MKHVAQIDWQDYYPLWRQRSETLQLNFAVRWHAFRRRFILLFWVFQFLCWLALIAVIAGTALVVSIGMGAFGKLPDRADLIGITTYQASEVYANDGTLLGRYYFENRSNTSYNDISPAFIQALLATEDVRFFSHDGIDFRSWGRVFFKTLLNGERSSGGGSTLTQQLVKNLYPREDYGHFSLVINKLREALIAQRVELLYTKEEILEMYLNTVSFSENTFGIKVAAQRFFNTEPGNLTPAEAAVLVAMLKAPTTYNPLAYPERAKDRRDLVLQQMANYDFISQALADSLMAAPICLNYSPLTHIDGLAPYFREHLRLELKKILAPMRKPNGMAYDLYTDGLRIFTTIDDGMQRMAENAVNRHIAELQRSFDEHLQGASPWEVDTVLFIAKYNSERYRRLRERGYAEVTIDSIFNTPVTMEVFSWTKGQEQRTLTPMDSIRYYLSLLNAGMVAMEPSSGAVRAWVGGIDYKFFQYDHVQSRRQVGSTFKPVVYSTALQQGFDPCHYYPNQLAIYPQYNFWMPRNADNRYGGAYSMAGGLSNSVNTVTVWLALHAGHKNVAALARRLGFEGGYPAVPAIALGAIEGSLQEMATVYGTFANRGRRPQPYYIKRIETATGEVLANFEAARDTCRDDHVLSTFEADLINQMLRTTVERGTARRLRWRYELTNDLAGKTGTSQNHSDGWFVGFNPSLVTAVWVGAESPAVRFRDLRLGQGANTALPIFAHFLDQLNHNNRYRNYTGARFPEPSAAVASALDCQLFIAPGADSRPDSTLQAKAVVSNDAPLNELRAELGTPSNKQ